MKLSIKKITKTNGINSQDTKTLRSTIAIIAFLCATLISFGQNSDFGKLDSFFQVLEDKERFFGSVAVTQAGELIYSKALGYADLEDKVFNNKDTKFRIGSISKTFTATLIMKAVELGKIDLDQNIDTYFPNIQNADKITIRFLLNHRSGITNFTDRSYYSWYTKPITRPALIDTIKSKGIDFEPDTDYAYSNSNYVLLSFILEDIFEDSYASILNEYITDPLNLKNTGYGGVINSSNNEAKSYQMKTEWEIEPEGDMSIPLGAGGIVSTPTDLCLFGEALFSGQVISAESLEQMKPVEGEEYGFALYGTEFNEMNGLGHGGNIDAFSSNLICFEENDICIALSCNGAGFGSHEVGQAVLSEMFDQPYALPSFEYIELTNKELDQYLGTYVSDELPMDMIFTKEDNTLFLQATGQSPGAVNALGNHKFSIIEYGVKIEFFPLENKMHFEQQGHEFDFIRQDSSAVEKPVELVEITKEDLEQYVGTYESSQLPMDLTITRKDNELIAQGTGQPSFPIKSDGNHQFSNVEIGLTITFIPIENKLNFVQGGGAFAMTLKESTESIDATDESTSEATGTSTREDLDQYVGTYECDEIPIDVFISKDEDTLLLAVTGQSASPLKDDGNHIYSIEKYGVKITFTPTDKNLKFEQGGAAYNMNLKK